MMFKINLKRLLKIIINKDILTYPQVYLKTEFHGNDYGGWSVFSKNISKNSIVFSVGVGTDISFDLSVINKYSCNIYAFDPTPYSAEFISNTKIPKEFKFIPYGVASYDGYAEFSFPEQENFVSFSMVKKSNKNLKCTVKKISTLMEELNLKKIDLLKMDIEGSEYSVIENIINENLIVDQILVEFHHRFNEIGTTATKRIVEYLNKNNYVIFWISKNGDEYSFINKSVLTYLL